MQLLNSPTKVNRQEQISCDGASVNLTTTVPKDKEETLKSISNKLNNYLGQAQLKYKDNELFNSEVKLQDGTFGKEKITDQKLDELNFTSDEKNFLLN